MRFRLARSAVRRHWIYCVDRVKHLKPRSQIRHATVSPWAKKGKPRRSGASTSWKERRSVPTPTANRGCFEIEEGFGCKEKPRLGERGPGSRGVRRGQSFDKG